MQKRWNIPQSATIKRSWIEFLTQNLLEKYAEFVMYLKKGKSMKGLDLVKKALEEGVVLFPKNFVEDNDVNAKYIGWKKGKNRGVKVYYIEEIDKCINQIP